MKESSGELTDFLAFKQHCPDIALYSGEDAMMPYLAGAEVAGLVSVCANVWPQATKKYVELALSGHHHSLFPVWKQSVDALFQVSNPVPLKVLMHLTNLINYPTLRSPLTELEISENPHGLKELMKADQEINQWFTQC